jgi:hypothetical protein
MRERNKSCNAGRDSCYTLAHRHSHFPLRAPARTTLTASPRRHRPSPHSRLPHSTPRPLVRSLPSPARLNTHTTLLVPYGLTPQPSSPHNTTTLPVHTDHHRSRHNPLLTGAHNTPACSSPASLPTICSSQISTTTDWRNKACSSQAHPYNCLLLTDSSCYKACSSQAHERTHIDTAQHQHNIHVSSSTSSLNNTSPQLSLSTSSSSPPNTAKPLTKLN